MTSMSGVAITITHPRLVVASNYKMHSKSNNVTNRKASRDPATYQLRMHLALMSSSERGVPAVFEKMLRYIEIKFIF